MDEWVTEHLNPGLRFHVILDEALKPETSELEEQKNLLNYIYFKKATLFARINKKIKCGCDLKECVDHQMKLKYQECEIIFGGEGGRAIDVVNCKDPAKHSKCQDYVKMAYSDVNDFEKELRDFSAEEEKKTLENHKMERNSVF